MPALTDRWAELNDHATLTALVETSQGLVVRTEDYESGWELGSYSNRPLRRATDSRTRVGFDASDRPCFVEIHSGQRIWKRQLLPHAGERVRLKGGLLEDLTWFDGARETTYDGSRTEIVEHHGELDVLVYEYDGNWGWTAQRFKQTPGGLVVEYVSPPEIAHAATPEAAIEAALAGHREANASISWDGRLSAPEPDASPDAWDGLAAPLAAVLRAAAPADAAFMDVGLNPRDDGHGTMFLFATAPAKAWHERARRLLDADDAEILRIAHQHLQLDWLAHAPPELLRQIRRALQSGVTRTGELARELSAELGISVGEPRESTYREPEMPTLRLRDREHLSAWLQEQGLTAEEAAPVVADAGWAIVLEHGGSGRTRLGGRPIVPAGTPWPETADGRPLTHLATLALDELPPVDDSHALPDVDFLAFFADTDEENEFWEPIEPGSPERDQAAVIHTPRGTPPDEPDGPSLKATPVTPRPRLQLRYVGYGYGQRLYGIDALAERVVERAADAINGAANDQLFGYPATVQDDGRGSSDAIALLHVDWRTLGSFLDAGDLLFFGSAEDIRACRWDQLTVWPGTC